MLLKVTNPQTQNVSECFDKLMIILLTQSVYLILITCTMYISQDRQVSVYRYDF